MIYIVFRQTYGDDRVIWRVYLDHDAAYDAVDQIDSYYRTNYWVEEHKIDDYDEFMMNLW